MARRPCGRGTLHAPKVVSRGELSASVACVFRCQARLSSPKGICLARDGVVFIADRCLISPPLLLSHASLGSHAVPCSFRSGNHRIRALSADLTTIYTVAGNGNADYADGTGAEAR